MMDSSLLIGKKGKKRRLVLTIPTYIAVATAAHLLLSCSMGFNHHVIYRLRSNHFKRQIISTDNRRFTSTTPTSICLIKGGQNEGSDRNQKSKDSLTPLSLENVTSLFESRNNSDDLVDRNSPKENVETPKSSNELDEKKQEQLNRLLEYPSFLRSEGLDNELASSMGRTYPNVNSSPLEGVLPVSELFYRSIPDSVDEEDVEEEDEVSSITDQDPDDEELPFSAEQTNSLETFRNKVQVRRNEASSLNGDDDNDQEDPRSDESSNDNKRKEVDENENENDKGSAKARRRARMRKKKKTQSKSKTSNSLGEVSSLFVQNKSQNKKETSQKSRKMVRRGMEMLVGGEPINADPPLRVVDLHYEGGTEDWAKVITLNSRDFGPLLHSQSIEKVSPVSRGLYCEHFVSNTLKWKVCPEYLRDILRWYEKITSTSDDSSKPKLNSYSELLEVMTSKIDEAVAANKLENDMNIDDSHDQQNVVSDDDSPKVTEAESTRGLGFGQVKKSAKKSRRQSSVTASPSDKHHEALYLQTELRFTIGLSAAEVECGEGGGFKVLRRILTRGIENSIGAQALDFFVRIARLVVTDIDDGADIDICLDIIHKSSYLSPKKKAKMVKRTNQALAQSVDSGDMALEIAKSAREENAWSPHRKAKFISEMIMDLSADLEGIGDDVEEQEARTQGSDDDDDDDENERSQPSFISKPIRNGSNRKRNVPYAEDNSRPFEKSDSRNFSVDDIYLGNGNGGVFPNYSESQKDNSSYKGNLGPLLLDAVVEKAIQNKPRVIAIGDVHGCIDELQALLRRCNYRPGDVIIFLGDLVSKGPDSPSVVQMAREIGAIGVRGNHDFEVIRWHQAIKSGADPPVIASDHFNIATQLDSADIKWLYSLPWYLSSKDLNALFVHAGFVSGIRLAKQNPRLMMNMRSILPDGTVTSKFFHNWPWARLWDGPQTVFFGHDADRGLQQYEHAIGLDTGCVYGGRLSACILPEKRLVSVPAKKEYFQYRRKHYD